MKIANLADGTQLRFPDETPDEVVTAAVKKHLAGGPSPAPSPAPIVSRGGAPATIGATPSLDRDVVSGRNLLGKDSTLTMRDVIEGIPNALSTAAAFTPAGAGIGLGSKAMMAARPAIAGVLGFAGGGIRDAVRAAMGEVPTAGVKERAISDALPAAVGQGIGEGVGLLSKVLPTASAKGMSSAATELGFPAGPLSDAPLAQMYTNKQAGESVFKGFDALQKIRTNIEPSRIPRSEVGAQMAKATGEASSFVRKNLGNKFNAVEAPFKGQSVDTAASLDAARDLPDTFKGVKAVQRTLGAGEIPAGEGTVRVVQAPFEEVRNLSKTPLTRSLRGKLEGDIESHIGQVAPDVLPKYQGLKSDWKSRVGDVFDRGVVAKVFKNPQELEAVFKVPGSSPGRLEAIKKAIDTHPDPRVSAEVWDTFKRAKFDQLMSGGPVKFAQTLETWEPRSLEVVFGADAPAIVRFKQLTDALASNPQQGKALEDLIMRGKPPSFKISSDDTWKHIAKTGLRAAIGGAAAPVVGAPVTAGMAAGAVGTNLYGLAQNIIAHNPNGGLSSFVNALESVLKSGRTGAFWNTMAATVRVGRSKRKRQAQSQTEDQKEQQQ